MRVLAATCALLALSACVSKDDTDSWTGQPVLALELHPLFVTMPVIKTRASDGTEIWNCYNGRKSINCSGIGVGTGSGTIDATRMGNTVSGNVSGYVNYSSFTSCIAGSPACNNLFYIKDGIVQRYNPVGSGGAICTTDSRLRPQYSTPTNYR
jgi:hypothetical protein